MHYKLLKRLWIDMVSILQVDFFFVFYVRILLFLGLEEVVMS